MVILDKLQGSHVRDAAADRGKLLSSSLSLFICSHWFSPIRSKLEVSGVTRQQKQGWPTKTSSGLKGFSSEACRLDGLWNPLTQKGSVHIIFKICLKNFSKPKGQFWINKNLGLMPDAIFSCVLCLESLYLNLFLNWALRIQSHFKNNAFTGWMQKCNFYSKCH